MKKVFIISLVLLTTVLFFLGIYNFAFKKNTSIATQPVEQDMSKKQLKKLLKKFQLFLVSLFWDRFLIKKAKQFYIIHLKMELFGLLTQMEAEKNK